MPVQRRRPTHPTLRARVTVHIGTVPALNDAAADLLEQIEVTSSLSEAARRLRYSYRRAWKLVDAMNRAWPQPLVRTATGGRRGGGSRLTDFGRRVLRGFRDVQIHVEALLDRSAPSFERGLRQS